MYVKVTQHGNPGDTDQPPRPPAPSSSVESTKPLKYFDNILVDLLIYF